MDFAWTDIMIYKTAEIIKSLVHEQTPQMPRKKKKTTVNYEINFKKKSITKKIKNKNN